MILYPIACALLLALQPAAQSRLHTVPKRQLTQSPRPPPAPETRSAP